MAIASLSLDDQRLIRKCLSDTRMTVDEDVSPVIAADLDQWLDLVMDVIEEQS